MAASLAAPHPRCDDMASESIIRNLATGMPLLVFRIIIIIKTQAGRGTAEAANIYLLRMEAPCIIRPRILLGEGIASFDDRNRIRRTLSKRQSSISNLIYPPPSRGCSTSTEDIIPACIWSI
jgi:hypothetical protein